MRSRLKHMIIESHLNSDSKLHPHKAELTAKQIVIVIVSVPDSYENIARFLECGFGNELAALHSRMWREK